MATTWRCPLCPSERPYRSLLLRHMLTAHRRVKNAVSLIPERPPVQPSQVPFSPIRLCLRCLLSKPALAFGSETAIVCVQCLSRRGEHLILTAAEAVRALRELTRLTVLDQYGGVCPCGTTDTKVLRLRRTHGTPAPPRSVEINKWLILTNFPKGFVVCCPNCRKPKRSAETSRKAA